MIIRMPEHINIYVPYYKCLSYSSSDFIENHPKHLTHVQIFIEKEMLACAE